MILNQVEALLNKLRQRIPGTTIASELRLLSVFLEKQKLISRIKSFVEAQRFDNAGVFSYSQEEGTVAADLPEQIDTQIKEERFHELMSLQAQISEDMHHNMEDMILEVLVEGCDEENPDLVFGRSYKEAPNIDGSILSKTKCSSR